MSLQLLLTGTHLARWAEERRAQGMLPHLVRRLILATTDPILRIDFPAEDAVNRPGYDGFLQTVSGNTFTPPGQSVWEMGVGQEPRQKANSDYASRTSDPANVVPGQTTFVFVTPRRWQGKTDWAAEKRAENVWADIRAYDADDLEQWLETAPAVAAWACRLIHRLPDGLRDLEEVGEEWAGRTNPPLNPEILLAGRGDCAERVRGWLAGPPLVLSLRAYSSEEAIAFFASLVARQDDLVRERTRSRAVVVTTPEAWRGVAGGNPPLILIAPPAIGSPQQAVRRGHHVLVAYGNDAGGLPVDVDLPRPGRRELEAALAAMGVPDGRARQLACESKGQITALLDLLGPGPVCNPPWATPAAAPALVPLLLAGAWSQAEGDAEAVAQLAHASPEELARLLARWANEADPPVRLVSGVWQWLSRKRAWPHLSRYITANHLAAFRQAVTTVLGEIDPGLDLPAEERWLAPLHNRARRYSGHLREGLAEGLAILATRGAGPLSGVGAEDFTRGVVCDLFGTELDPRRWCSLAGVLPLLAEAAPDVFLTAVERDVIGRPEVLASLFEEEGVFGGSRHTHLLCALETLAWSAEHLSRAAVALAGLAARDPGGRMANRPRESLRAIFLPWRPQTSAPLGVRFAALDAVAREDEEVAFGVCRQMLPRGHDAVTPTSRPRWRTWRPDTAEGVPEEDYQHAVQLALERLLAGAANDIRRWAGLLHPFPVLDPHQTAALVDALEAADLCRLLPQEREDLRYAVRRVVHLKRSHDNLFPGLGPALVGRLEAVYHCLAPDDLVQRHAWLFGHSPDILSVQGEGWEAEHAAVEVERAAAVAECLEALGIDAVVQLAERAQNPFLPGWFAGNSDLPEESLAALLALCLDRREGASSTCGLGAVAGRLRRCGWAWVEQLFAAGGGRDWPAGRRARFACGLLFEVRVWDMVEAWGEEAASIYWREVGAQWAGNAASDAPRAVRTLVARGRVFRALELASMYLAGDRTHKDVPPDVYLEVLRATVTAGHGETPASGDLLGYAVGELLDAVAKAGVADEGELARIEWFWLPVLRHTRRGLQTLQRGLSRDPQFFAAAIGLVYRPRGDGHPTRGPETIDETTLARAKQAWDLLQEWQVLPGACDDGTVDAGRLQEWATAARQCCGAAGHAARGDEHIGMILAHSPKGDDGAWPHEAVRAILESVRSEHLEAGLHVGVLKRRGATVRSRETGGEPERALAERHLQSAAEVAPAFPRTAAVLRRVAESYRREARHEDDRRDLEEFE
jgi:hypothetical protein